MPTYALTSLLGIRRRDEDRAGRLLTQATAARAQAEEEQQRLVEAARDVRARLDGRRAADPAPAGERAADAALRQRFWARLDAEAAAKAEAAAAHGRDVLGPARAREAEARALHLAARRQRETVEKAVERREAARRRQAARRADAEADDAPRPPPLRTPRTPR